MAETHPMTMVSPNPRRTIPHIRRTKFKERLPWMPGRTTLKRLAARQRKKNAAKAPRPEDVQVITPNAATAVPNTSTVAMYTRAFDDI
jgi:hypothetical protein